MATSAETEHAISSGAEQIYATIRHGSGDGPRPAAIMLHGFGSFRDELTGFGELAEKLSAAGITSLRPDMRGCGKSGTRGRMHPMWDWVEDARACVDWLAGQPDVAADRIGVIGMSMGGGVACAAAAFDPRIKAVVALAPVTDGHGWLKHLWTSSRGEAAWQGFLAHVAEDNIRRANGEGSREVDVLDILAYGEEDQRGFHEVAERYPAFLTRILLSAADSVMQARIVPLAGMIAPRPLLVVHSRADASVPVGQGEALAAAAGDLVKLMLIEDSPHCFWISPESDSVQRSSAAWMESHL